MWKLVTRPMSIPWYIFHKEYICVAGGSRKVRYNLQGAGSLQLRRVKVDSVPRFQFNVVGNK